MTQHWQPSPRLRAQVLELYGATCWLCGEPISGRWDIDHVQPRSVAPARMYDVSNMRPAHPACNRRRGDKPPGGDVWQV